MQLQPALRDRVFNACAIFGSGGLVSEQEGVLQLFDIDPAMLRWLKSSRMFHQAARVSGSANGLAITGEELRHVSVFAGHRHEAGSISQYSN
jgi:hypothetical protein